MNIVITTLFGIEAVTARELVTLGFAEEQLSVSDGQVVLSPEPDNEQTARAVARCNLHLATAERVLLQLARFPAHSFDALFDTARALPWEEWLPRGYAFHVNGYSRKSRLFGVSACQSLIKKAIVDRLLSAWQLPAGSQLQEDPQTGLLRVQFAIVSDQVSLMVDTSGDGLHKRGYRPLQHEAPIRETLAAAILRLARYNPDSPEVLYDPMCGSGTFLIEAAMQAARIAPGLNRSFSAEQWPLVGPAAFVQEREAARSLVRPPADKPFIFGSDLSEQAIAVAHGNAERAGVASLIGLRQADMLDLKAAALEKLTGYQRHLVVCNPPYGERLLDEEKAMRLYRGLCQNYLSHGKARAGIRFFVITPYERFEQLAGGQADKRRKLYNGMIKCTLYQYFKWRK